MGRRPCHRGPHTAPAAWKWAKGGKLLPDYQNIQQARLFPINSRFCALSSSSSGEAEIPCYTPRNQPIMNPGLRLQKAQEFVSGLQLEWSECNQEQKLRAKRLQSPADFTWSPTEGDAPPGHRYTTTFRKEWELFVGTLPEPHKTAFSTFQHVMFNDDAMTNYMAIRKQQLSGNFSAHVSALFQHYAVCYGSSSEVADHTMIDVRSFILNNLPKPTQKTYIEKGTITGMGLGAFDRGGGYTGTMSCPND